MNFYFFIIFILIISFESCITINYVTKTTTCQNPTQDQLKLQLIEAYKQFVDDYIINEHEINPKSTRFQALNIHVSSNHHKLKNNHNKKCNYKI